MKEKHVVKTLLLPSDSGKRNLTKKDFKQFDSFEEAVDYIRSTLKAYSIEVDVEDQIKKRGVVGGKIDGEKDKYHNYTMSIDSGYMPDDVLKSLINGEIKFKTMGHNHISYQGKDEQIKLSVIKKIEDGIGNWITGADDLPNNYFALSRAYTPIEIGKRIIDLGYYCWDCGEETDIILLDEKTVCLSNRKDWWTLTDGMDWEQRTNFQIKIDQMNPCPINPDAINGIKTSIRIESGDLIFANHFGKVDALYEFEGKEYHSINGLLGRIELAEQLAKKDIGYGQMGNMSVNIYLRKDGKEVIIGDSYYIDAKGKEKYRKFNGFKELGNIPLSVWRWQCADRKVLEKYEYPLPELKKNSQMIDEEYRDWVLAEVVPGKWKIEHYFDTSDCSDGIYSRLYLEEA
jgi:hypothetical protein